MKSGQGFTFIEIMVVVAVMAILTTVGLATYVNFNRRQIVVQSARRLVSELKYAQSLAVNNQKPGACAGDDLLHGYTLAVDTLTTPATYSIAAVCSSGSYIMKMKNLESTVAVEPGGFTQVTFSVLHRGVSFTPAAVNSLSLSGFGYQATVVVGLGGEIKIN